MENTVKTQKEDDNAQLKDIAVLRETIKETTAQIMPADEDAIAAAEQRQDILAKPPGSLGGLEEIAIRMAGITGQVIPEGPRGSSGQGNSEGACPSIQGTPSWVLSSLAVITSCPLPPGKPSHSVPRPLLL